ncbi:histidine phosphatase family protein [Sphingomonas radiodurans]|uniref:histidine phosphatase family protein n=1 Tax=Sphingomonas radiodurans TaxID=2890321 RepID=UPI001E3EA96E|nr:histidine phosphatase family protein [Sphingomonas radiodurans]WBH16067.1 histidine phosphatase family protein [Sphingomonas radiodurans]
MRAIIVRHGNTFAPGEPPRRIGARTDLALVKCGREQARALADNFASVRFDRCLTSPLLRTRKTAAIVVPYLVAESAAWLREIDHGSDEGQTEEAVTARIGAEALAAWEGDAVPPPGWIVNAAERIAAWRGFFEGSEGTVLLVTSNGAARFALIALGAKPAKLRTGAFGEVIDHQVIAWNERPPA